MLRTLLAYLRHLTRDRSMDGVNALSRAMDHAAAQMGATCEICNGTAVYVCPICRTVIALHSHENDYSCEEHGFVNPIREHDGARISGDGRAHALRVS